MRVRLLLFGVLALLFVIPSTGARADGGFFDRAKGDAATAVPGESQPNGSVVAPFDEHARLTVDPSERAYQLLWDDQALPMDDGSGSGPIWVPVSLRLVTTEDMNAEIELVNIGTTPAVSPYLTVTVLRQGQVLASEQLYPENEWVDVNGSVFYQSLSVFGGSLGVIDWDEVRLSAQPKDYFLPDMAAYAGIGIEGERVSNSGSVTIGSVYFIEVTRDADGIFTASCFGPSTGANILPGSSVRAPGLSDLSSPGGCGFSDAGMLASTLLGVGGPFSAEYVIAQIVAPV